MDVTWLCILFRSLDTSHPSPQKYTVKTLIIRVLEIRVFKENAKIRSMPKMGSELRVSERLTFGEKITSTRIAWLDDSAKISRRALYYRHFTVLFDQRIYCVLLYKPF